MVPAPSDLPTEKVTGLDGRVGEDKCPQINVHSSFRLRYVTGSPSWSIVYALYMPSADTEKEQMVILSLNTDFLKI